jgi:transposase
LPEIKSVLRAIQSDALERLDEAFDAFFRRLQHGEKPGFPRFVRHSKLSDMSGERRTRSPSGFHPTVPT